MSIVGSYYAQAYCDGIDEDDEQDRLRHMYPTQYDPAPNGRRFGPHPVDGTGQNRSEAYREIRRQGWHITRDERAFCPGCVALGRHKQ